MNMSLYSTNPRYENWEATMHGEPNTLEDVDVGILGALGTTLAVGKKAISNVNTLSPGRHISVEFWVYDLVDGSPMILLKKGGTTIITVSISGSNYLITWGG